MRRITGPAPGTVREIDAEIVIGRQGDLIFEDVEASRRHAAVRPVEGGVEVEDLGSANGTFVDGTRLEGKTTLLRNATVRIGKTEFGIEISLPAGHPDQSSPPPEVTVARAVPTRPDAAAAGASATPVAAAAAPGSPGGESSPPEKAQRDSPNPKLMLPAMILALAAIAAIVLIVAGGGSNKKHGRTQASVKPHCAAHPPKLIKDGFPEPKMLFSHNGTLDLTLKASTAATIVDGKSYPAMAYNGQIPAPTLVTARATTSACSSTTACRSTPTCTCQLTNRLPCEPGLTEVPVAEEHGVGDHRRGRRPPIRAGRLASLQRVGAAVGHEATPSSATTPKSGANRSRIGGNSRPHVSSADGRARGVGSRGPWRRPGSPWPPGGRSGPGPRPGGARSRPGARPRWRGSSG